LFGVVQTSPATGLSRHGAREAAPARRARLKGLRNDE
jgi:hypothetical protein